MKGTEHFLLTPIYRPPETCPFDFNIKLRDYLNMKKNAYDHHIVVGDINFDILSNKHEAQEYLNILSENGYVSCVNAYTRVVGNSRSCLDHFFVKSRKCTDIE